jgi:hypothetical protein
MVDEHLEEGPDDTLEFLLELQRAAPDLASVEGPGTVVQLSLRDSMEAGLERVRALPDGAGIRAFFQALGCPEDVVRAVERQLGA